jgi:hypothetical protein
VLAGSIVLESAVGHQAAHKICLWRSSHAVLAARAPLNRMVGNVVIMGTGEKLALCVCVQST